MNDVGHSEILEEGEFEKRADYLDVENLLAWDVSYSELDNLKKNILSKNSYLIAGPRGTGKTHQFKIAHLQCLADENAPLSLYVSYKEYYSLEPLLISTSSAIAIFQTWVLAKINVEILKIALEKSLTLSGYDGFSITELETYISTIEKSTFNKEHDSYLQKITITNTKKYLVQLIHASSRKRIILLLDDAALTLTHDFMIEFFEIFKNLKANNISPKASVYQGTTQYGPRFHLGQDADIVPIWPYFQSTEYLKFLDDLIAKRYSKLIEKIPKEIVELLKIGSFGNPRGFITLLAKYIDNPSTNTQVKFNKIFDERCGQLEDEYLSLAGKIPHYSSILMTGHSFFNKVLEELKEENKKLTNEKCFTLGLDKDLNFQQQRMVSFLIEAGLIFEIEPPVNHGDGRVYRRLIPHSLFMLKNKVLNPSSKGFNVEELIQKFNSPHTKHPKRKTINTILNEEELSSLTLVLANCQNCSAKRISEKQKFCTECGEKLQNISSYKECLSIPVESLPLTEWQKNKILNETSIKIVQDFLTLANPSQELKKAYGIGDKKSEKIFELVIKYVKEYLS